MAEVRNIPEAHHYEITVDGEHAGLEEYVDSGNQRSAGSGSGSGSSVIELSSGGTGR